MRELKSSDKNILKVNDARSGTEMEIYYRTPTPREEALYQTRLVRKKGRKIVMNTPAVRLEFGLAIVTGFRPGDFCMDGKPISSEKDSENYYEGWKDLLKSGAADIVSILAMTVFEGARVAGLDPEIVDEAEVIEETAVPLGKS